MAYVATGTITTDTTTSVVTCKGWVTLAAHLDSGSGTWTWQFKGPDGVWRNIFGGPDGTTSQAFTATNMVNAYFGSTVEVRGSASSGSTPVWDYQILSDPKNFGSG